MKYLALIVFVWSALAASPPERVYQIDASVHDNGKREFISHTGDGRFDSYLIQDVNFAPVETFRKTLEENLPVKLLNRGEAHITVITPIEYYDVLRSKVSMLEIEQIAKNEKIQASEFSIECLGIGKKNEDETYFIVVNSPKLVAIRKKVQELFEQRGGAVDAFSATSFYPHITLGFTKRDLHESDGVIKDQRSCQHKISVF